VQLYDLNEHHALTAYWGSGGIAPRNRDFGTKLMWVVSFTHRPLYHQGKSPWYPLDKRLPGAQCRSGRNGEEKNSQPLPGLEPPIIQPVAQRYTTELSWLMLQLCSILEIETAQPLSILKKNSFFFSFCYNNICDSESDLWECRGMHLVTETSSQKS
jgi:hypothetical protein